MVKLKGMSAHPKMVEIWTQVGEILGADMIEYFDKDNHEVYHIYVNGEVLEFKAHGNNIDGGFMWPRIVPKEQKPLTRMQRLRKND